MVGGYGGVTFGRFGCKRFERLSSEALDRALSDTESRFIDQHRHACGPCRQTEASRRMALNMLKSATLDIDPDETFDRRVLRRAKVDGARQRLSYWSPAAIGCVVTLVLVLAAVQLASKPTGLRENNSPAGEARLDSGQAPTIPNLDPTP